MRNLLHNPLHARKYRFRVNRSPLALPARLLAGLLFINLLGISAHGQDANSELLAKAGKLYYSSAKNGLTGFDCTLHRDWQALFMAVDKTQTVAEDDPRIVALNTVKIILHARLKGGSTIDWIRVAAQGKPLDKESVTLLENQHKDTEQALLGVLQLWIPFIDGSIVPESPEGAEIKNTADGHTFYAEQGGNKLTEVFDNDLVLRHFDVEMNGTSVKLVPVFEPTDKGLLVNRFDVTTLPAGTAPDKAQEMHVGVEYQTIRGFPIPQQLNIKLGETGVFNFTLDGCRVNP